MRRLPERIAKGRVLLAGGNQQARHAHEWKSVRIPIPMNLMFFLFPVFLDEVPRYLRDNSPLSFRLVSRTFFSKRSKSIRSLSRVERSKSGGGKVPTVETVFLITSPFGGVIFAVYSLFLTTFFARKDGFGGTTVK